MGKWAYALMKLFKLASNNPEGFGAFIVWLISAIIGILIVALIVGGIAKLIGKDFEEWFAKGAVAWTFVELINGIIIMCS